MHRRSVKYLLLLFALGTVFLLMLTTSKFHPFCSSQKTSRGCLQHQNCNLLSGVTVPNMGIAKLMFFYAGLYGIAKKTDKKLLLPIDLELTALYEAFAGLSIPANSERNAEFQFEHIFEKSVNFDENLPKMPCDKNVSLHGSLQSWRYFVDVFPEIRNEFTFRRTWQWACRSKIDKTLSNLNRQRAECILIGVHLRRWDLFKSPHTDFGYLPASKSYLEKAIRYFREEFEKTTNCLLFLLVGNDYQWNLRSAPRQRDVFVLRPQTAIMDLCLLASCDHVIMSVGAFGWWAGFLSGGKVIYQKAYSRMNSALYNMSKTNDFYLPEWIPL